MRRHRFDAISFVFGLSFLVLAVALSGDVFSVGPHVLRWFGAGFLLLLGALLLITSRSRTEDRT